MNSGSFELAIPFHDSFGECLTLYSAHCRKVVGSDKELTMSGVYQTETLWCKACRAMTTHHTEWESEQPNLVLAQCEHHGPRMITYVQPSDIRTIGKMTYQFA